ncbi:preprotein translocase subunit SecE [Candidatus Uhrbacteria bacterium]|nr:preprotein translocase subunit SecE [Candidatus Uhrbacteria bacterium]
MQKTAIIPTLARNGPFNKDYPMNPIAKTFDYFRSARAELEKVTWPSRQEIIRYTALVIGASAILAGFFAALDYGLSTGVNELVKRRAPSAIQNTVPVVPDLQPTPASGDIEAVDASGNPVDVQVTPIQ